MGRKIFKRVSLAVVLSLGLLGGPASSAVAQTYTVTNLNDTGAAGDGSLRGELVAANESPGPDGIAFAPGLAGTITLGGNGLQVKDAVDIEGPGPSVITVAQSSANRVFHVNLSTAGAVTIAGLHIANGTAPSAGLGGDVFNDPATSIAEVTISNCLLTGGTAGVGGGIASTGGAPLTVRSSTVSGNSAEESGGVIALGPFTIHDSTIAGNTAIEEVGGLGADPGNASGLIENSTIAANSSPSTGGATLNVEESGTIVVRNTTVAGNLSGTFSGGGLFLQTFDAGTIEIVGSTISGNRAASAQGGGIGVFTGLLSATAGSRLEDTIVAGNSASGGGADVSGPIAAAFSLIGDPAGTTITESVPGSDLLGLVPQLGPLQDNGGPTATMALAPSSPAVNNGAAFGLASDQRGSARPVLYPGVSISSAAGADDADIGAYELQAPPPTPSPPAPQQPIPPRFPQVRVSCPKGARPGGCKFKLQVFSAKPHKSKAKGKRGRAKAPVAESAVAKVKLGPGKSASVTLTPKPKFAARLAAAKSVLVREVETIKGETRTSYRRLKVVG